ncbi:hypothetical protein HDU98_009016 [Podochytrium sp. JEL0797]|nr:hypothetical protein HDU98_009016 [Podochytrium sp. JEL0797]
MAATSFDPVQDSFCLSLPIASLLFSPTTTHILPLPNTLSTHFTPGDKPLLLCSPTSLTSLNRATLSTKTLSIPSAASIAPIPASSFVFVGCRDGSVICVDPAAGKGSGYAVPALAEGAVACLAMDSGNVLAVGYTGGEIVLWQVRERVAAVTFRTRHAIADVKWMNQTTLLTRSENASVLTAWNASEATTPEKGVKRAAQKLFSNLKQTFSKDSNSQDLDPAFSIPEYTIPVPLSDLGIESLEADQTVLIRDFHLLEGPEPDLQTVCLAWTLADEQGFRSFVSFVTFSPPPAPNKPITIHATQTASIPYTHPRDRISRVSPFSESVYVTVSSQYAIQAHAFVQSTYSLSPIKTDEIPASLHILTLPRILASHLSQPANDRNASYACAATAHAEDGCIRLWTVGNTGTSVDSLLDCVCVRNLVPFPDTPAADSDSEDSAASANVRVRYSDRDGVLVVASGAVLAVLVQKVEEEEEEGELDIDDDGVMDELDRVVDEVVGFRSLGDSHAPLVREITSIQLEDVECETPPGQEDLVVPLQFPPPRASHDEPRPPPIPPRNYTRVQDVPPPRLEPQEDVFVKNNTALVTFPHHSTLSEPWSQRWTALVQIVASGVIEAECVSIEFEMVAFSTAYGDVTLVDLNTGVTVFTEQLGTRWDAAGRVSMIQFASTFSSKEPNAHPTLFIATQSGALFSYAIRLDTVPTVSRRTTVHPHPTTTPPPFPSNPLLLAFLNQDGYPIPSGTSSNTRRDTEHYLVWVGPATVTVILFQPLKPAQKLAETTHRGEVLPVAGDHVAGWVMGKLFGRPSTESLRGAAVVPEEAEHGVAAQIVKLRDGAPGLVVVMRSGEVVVLGLPGLDRVNAETVQRVVVGAADEVAIFEDGCVGVVEGNVIRVGREWDVGDKVMGAGRRKVGGEMRLYDFVKQNAYWKEREEGGRDRSELDALFMGPRDTTLSDSRARMELMSGGTANPDTANPVRGGGGGSSSLGGAFDQTKNALNERGELLQDMNQKFADLDQGASDFLRTIKEYNARQEKKKWWEL